LIRLDVEDGVAMITIDRAEKANALTEAGKRQLADMISTAGQRGDVSALVLTGAGTRCFCAGSDVAEMQSFDSEAMYRMLGAERSMYRASLSCSKPVVAAVNGFALGAGCILVMTCDYAVAAETARFGTPELTIGVSAPLEGFLLPLIVGLGHARRLFYTGQQLDAAEANRLGLVQEVIGFEECRPRAVAVAKEIASLPGESFRVQKTLLLELISSGNLDTIIEASRFATSLQFADPTTAGALRQSLSRRR
jgi:enoyl-CoA hydratase/carnithine racemase